MPIIAERGCNMIPQIRYYARLDRVTGTKTPKYVMTMVAGYYEPMSRLIGKDGKVSFFLLGKRDEQPDRTPPMSLQAKNSYNLTGLKDYYTDGGKISGFAYGEPHQEPTYKHSGKNTPAPFYEYRNDGYLFIMHQSESPTPDFLEWLVLEDARDMIAAYCKMLVMGGFDEALERIRKQARPCVSNM